MIQVQNLTHRYGDRIALSNISFEVRKGEIFGLLGPNGGGKSTLFRILSTMMVPTDGRAVIAGSDVERDPAGVRRHVGVVFQTQSLDKALTVEENLRAQGHLHGLSGATLRDRMTAAMERLGLNDRRKDLVETLSGGLRRRVEITGLTPLRVLTVSYQISGAVLVPTNAAIIPRLIWRFTSRAGAAQTGRPETCRPRDQIVARLPVV